MAKQMKKPTIGGIKKGKTPQQQLHYHHTMIGYSMELQEYHLQRATALSKRIEKQKEKRKQQKKK